MSTEFEHQIRALHTRGVAPPVAERIAAIPTLGEAWTTRPLPTAPWAALARAAEVTPEMLAWGLDAAAQTWTDAGVRRLIAAELDGPDALDGHDARIVVAVLASTVPPAGLQSVLLALLTGARVLVRPAARLVPFVRAMLADAARRVPWIGERAAVVEVDSHDAVSLAALADAADAVVVHGSDETVAAWRALTDPEAVVGYGHRVSLAALGAPAVTSLLSGDGALAEAIGLDLCVWDQAGCLSPRALLVEAAPGETPAIAAAVARGVATVEARFPAFPAEASARAARANWLRARRFDAEVVETPGGAALLAHDAEAPLELAPTSRVLPVVAVADFDALVAACASFGPRLQCLGQRGFDTEQLRRALADAGLNRVCPPGEMQRPPIDWFHDGIGSLAPLVAALRRA